MREVLFRGRCKGGPWLSGSLLVYGDGYSEICVPDGEDALNKFRVDPETVGQYTGLTDQNGKKIFEGDIIKYEPEDPAMFVGVVKFGEYSPDGGALHATNIGFYVEWLEHDGKRPYLRKDLGFWAKFRKIEIIGNIHDNPELLGGAENG